MMGRWMRLRVGGLRDIVNGYGLLFPQGNAQALAGQVLKLYQNQGYYNEIADRCFSRAQQFDIQHMVTAYIHVYENLLE